VQDRADVTQALCSPSVDPHMVGMRLLSLALLVLAAPAVAQAQCRATPGGPGATVLSCPGGTSVLQTDPTGTVTGLVNGQAFVGRNYAPGTIVGTLGGAPYGVQGGVAPEPPDPLSPPSPLHAPRPMISAPPYSSSGTPPKINPAPLVSP
jgi:hypothetical protein